VLSRAGQTLGLSVRLCQVLWLSVRLCQALYRPGPVCGLCDAVTLCGTLSSSVQSCQADPGLLMVGNNVNKAQPWEPIIDKIRNNLNRWANIHPTLVGKKTIVQAVVRGRTQFLTKAQGMPTSVSDAINQEIHTFLWEGASTAPIAKDMLYNEITCGGLDLLNLQSQNKAINIIWLKEYLNMSPTRPTWAYVTDILLCKSCYGSTLTIDQLGRRCTSL
jgi:hypothetical protein